MDQYVEGITPQTTNGVKHAGVIFRRAEEEDRILQPAMAVVFVLDRKIGSNGLCKVTRGLATSTLPSFAYQLSFYMQKGTTIFLFPVSCSGMLVRYVQVRSVCTVQ